MDQNMHNHQQIMQHISHQQQQMIHQQNPHIHQHHQQQQIPQQQQHILDPQKREDTAALKFLAMAEYFRSSKPPCYKAAAKCLIASTKTRCSTLLKAHCHYQLGKLLFYYTKNLTMAIEHLTTAHQIFKDIGGQVEEYRLKTACLIAECSLSLQQNDCILPLLKSEAPYTRKYPLLHGKALMLTIEALSIFDVKMALEVADMGLRYFNDLNNKVMECYFQLVKSLLYSRISGHDEQLSHSVTEFSNLVTLNPNVLNINDMRAFCYTIQLSYFLMVGMVNNSKKCLKQLQVTVQNMSREHDIQPHFHWMKKEMLTSLAYVMTAICSIQNGDFNKAIKYNEVSRNHLNELNAQMKKPEWGVIGRGYERFSAHLHFALNDAMGQMYIAQSKPEKVFDNLNEMIKVLKVVPKDLKMFEGQVHLLMGMYYQYVEDYNNAEYQLLASVNTANDYDVKVLSKLCLSMIYLFQSRESDFYDVYDSVRHNKLEMSSSACKVVSQFVGALHSFAHGKISDCKNLVTDAVVTCQEREILRVQAFAMLIICRIFNCKDVETIVAGKKMAKNTNDPAIIAWALKTAIDHYERRVEDEKDLSIRENEKPYIAELQQIENLISNNKRLAIEQQLPKYATMTNFETELATNWRGSLI